MAQLDCDPPGPGKGGDVHRAAAIAVAGLLGDELSPEVQRVVGLCRWRSYEESRMNNCPQTIEGGQSAHKSIKKKKKKEGGQRAGITETHIRDLRPLPPSSPMPINISAWDSQHLRVASLSMALAEFGEPCHSAREETIIWWQT